MSTATKPKPTKTKPGTALASDLKPLAAEIRKEVRLSNRGVAQAERSTAKSVEHALKAGELLTKARAEVKHGQWEPWLRANFEFTQQTANGYMRLYERQITGARDLPKSMRDAHRKLAEERATREELERLQNLKSAETRKEREAAEAEWEAEYEAERPEREAQQAAYEERVAKARKESATIRGVSEAMAAQEESALAGAAKATKILRQALDVAVTEEEERTFFARAKAIYNEKHLTVEFSP